MTKGNYRLAVLGAATAVLTLLAGVPARAWVTNGTATNVTATSAWVQVRVSPAAGTGVVHYGIFNYSTNATLWANASTSAITASTQSVQIVGLTAAEKYYYMWAVVTNGTTNWASGVSSNFVTLSGPPTNQPVASNQALMVSATNGVIVSPTNFIAANGLLTSGGGTPDLGLGLAFTNQTVVFSNQIGSLSSSVAGVGLAFSNQTVAFSNQFYGFIPNTGGTASNAILTTRNFSGTAPASNEFVSADWVRNLFDSGTIQYNTTNEFLIGTTTNYLFYGVTQDTRFARTYSGITNNQYIGLVMTTGAYQQVTGPIVVNSYLAGVSAGGGIHVLEVHPEVYFTYDNGTNLLGDYTSAKQAINTAGVTTLYSWVVSFPQQNATNAAGFKVVRRFKVDTSSGSGGNDIRIVGGNGLDSHIAFQVPASSSTTVTIPTNTAYVNSNNAFSVRQDFNSGASFYATNGVTDSVRVFLPFAIINTNGTNAALTAGNLYQLTSTSQWWVAAINTNQTMCNRMLGIALGASASANGVLTFGEIQVTNNTLSAGDPLWVGTNAGLWTATQPTNSSGILRCIGYATWTNRVFFRPDNVWGQR